MMLFKGDCLEVMKNIPDGSMDLVLTDPPYGKTQNKWDKKIPLEHMWEQLNRITKSSGAMCFHCQQPFTSELVVSNIKNFKYCWIWSKKQCGGFLNAKKQPLRNVEDIAVFYRNQCTYNPQMKRGKLQLKNTGAASDNYRHYEAQPHFSDEYYPTLLLDFPLQRFKGGHPTQKPVALLEYLIKTYTNEGETVLDFTMGSGSTGVACINTNRHFVGIELDENYFNIATERIENALGTRHTE